MKKFNFIFAIAMMVVAAASVAVVSCKKDTTGQDNAKGTDTQAFDYRKIEDKVTYFTDFKKKMKETKGNETFNLDDAAWHLACLANIGYCNVNVKLDDFLFDTIDMQVDVENGTMRLSDISAAYDQMCAKIDEYKKGFDHCDQNLYYINVSINAYGDAKIALMNSFTYGAKSWVDNPWYFSDPFEAADACDTYFSEDSVYSWKGLAVTELNRVLNIFEHHSNGTGQYGTWCYTPTRSHTFDYTNTHDLYSSGYFYVNESRVFAKKNTSINYNYDLDNLEMCYCLDSYLGLGYDYLSDNNYTNENPVCWTVSPIDRRISYWYYHFHQLKVDYGVLFSNPNPQSK